MTTEMGIFFDWWGKKSQGRSPVVGERPEKGVGLISDRMFPGANAHKIA
jgi:hypothetical protein